jgi:predicted nucleic acid-binding protein
MGRVTIIGSQALDFEIGKMKNQMRKMIVRFFYASVTVHIALTPAILARADTFRRASPMRLLDSLHLACAEYAGAEALLTTDDKFERWGNALDTTVKLVNPIRYLEELP